jgi:dihydroorotase
MKTLIKNARVVLPTETAITNVLIEDDKIAEIDPAIQVEADQVVDATGLVLMPGVIDDQVHFREPGLTHKEDLAHASRACAAGGVTSFLEMPNTIPNATTQEKINDKLAIASNSSLVNYGFYIGATPNNVEDLKNAKRTPGIKIFIGSSTGDLLVDGQGALERIFAETSLPICAHCEDESTVRANADQFAGNTDIATHSKIRDHKAAIVATRRAVDLAVRHQHRFHTLHVSTAAEIEVVSSAPGIVSAEVCPHHLFFNIDDYERLGSLVKMNPSIKTTDDNAALWQALLDEKITVIATDHAPHTLDEKRQPYPKCPSGLPAVENYFALILNQVAQGKCDLQQVAKWMSREPARIWNMVNKGSIVVGNDADLALVDLNLTRSIVNEQQHTKCKWSPWAGESLTGWPVRTWVMGREVYRLEDGQAKFDDSVKGSEILYNSP